MKKSKVVFRVRQLKKYFRHGCLNKLTSGRWSQNVEVMAYEEFPTIHNYYTTGKIIYLKMQLKPGILHTVTGREVAF